MCAVGDEVASRGYLIQQSQIEEVGRDESEGGWLCGSRDVLRSGDTGAVVNSTDAKGTGHHDHVPVGAVPS